MSECAANHQLPPILSLSLSQSLGRQSSRPLNVGRKSVIINHSSGVIATLFLIRLPDACDDDDDDEGDRVC